MKNLLRELGVVLIIAATLTFFANAQSLMGLPEFGVTLSGMPDNPVVGNHSGQTIIGHVLRVYFTNGNLPINFANLKVRDIWEGRKGLEPNRDETPLLKFFATPSPSIKSQVQGQVMESPVQVVLDSVVFANGQMVGPDATKNFEPFTVRAAALKELATFALEARQNGLLQPTLWSELERLTTQRTREDLWKIQFAGFLRRAHLRNNDEEVYGAAGHIMAIPSLWREK